MILNEQYAPENVVSEDPFGNTTSKSGSMADENPFRFSTKYFDDELGLSYYGYRYYSASLGRWLNRDPIGEDGGANLYGLLRNNPANSIDLLGLEIVKQKLFWRSPYLYQASGSSSVNVKNWGKYHMLLEVEFDDATGEIKDIDLIMQKWLYFWRVDDSEKGGITWTALREKPTYDGGKASFPQVLSVVGSDFDYLLYKYVYDVGMWNVKLPGVKPVANWIAKKTFGLGVSKLLHKLDALREPNAYLKSTFTIQTYCDENNKYYLGDLVEKENARGGAQMYFTDKLEEAGGDQLHTSWGDIMFNIMYEHLSEEERRELYERREMWRD